MTEAVVRLGPNPSACEGRAIERRAWWRGSQVGGADARRLNQMTEVR